MYEAEKGDNFHNAVKKLQNEIKWERGGNPKNPTYKVMKFNDLLITVSMDSNIDDLSIIYDLKSKIRRLEKK